MNNFKRDFTILKSQIVISAVSIFGMLGTILLHRIIPNIVSAYKLNLIIKFSIFIVLLTVITGIFTAIQYLVAIIKNN